MIHKVTVRLNDLPCSDGELVDSGEAFSLRFTCGSRYFVRYDRGTLTIDRRGESGYSLILDPDRASVMRLRAPYGETNVPVAAVRVGMSRDESRLVVSAEYAIAESLNAFVLACSFTS